MADGSNAMDLLPLLAPGGAVYVTGEDHVRVTSFNSATGVRLAIEGRFLRPSGQAVPFGESHVPNTDRTANTSSFRLNEGWLLNLHVRASEGTPRRGQCFVLVELVRGSGAAAAATVTLLQGYVTDTQRRAFPGSDLESSIDGRGVLRSVTGTDPAANTEISETVPTNARWLLWAVRLTLVTDANVANRLPQLTIDDGTNNILTLGSSAVQAASVSQAHYFGGQGFAGGASGGHHAIPGNVAIPLPGGFRIGTNTVSRQAGDNYAAPQLLVEEWIED